VRAVHRDRAAVGRSDRGVPVVAGGAEDWPDSAAGAEEAPHDHRRAPRRARWDRDHPALRRDHGARRMGLSAVASSANGLEATHVGSARELPEPEVVVLTRRPAAAALALLIERAGGPGVAP